MEATKSTTTTADDDISSSAESTVKVSAEISAESSFIEKNIPSCPYCQSPRALEFQVIYIHILLLLLLL
jgi:hypothetical protein